MLFRLLMTSRLIWIVRALGRLIDWLIDFPPGNVCTLYKTKSNDASTAINGVSVFFISSQHMELGLEGQIWMCCLSERKKLRWFCQENRWRKCKILTSFDAFVSSFRLASCCGLHGLAYRLNICHWYLDNSAPFNIVDHRYLFQFWCRFFCGLIAWCFIVF